MLYAAPGPGEAVSFHHVLSNLYVVEMTITLTWPDLTLKVYYESEYVLSQSLLWVRVKHVESGDSKKVRINEERSHMQWNSVKFQSSFGEIWGFWGFWACKLTESGYEETAFV